MQTLRILDRESGNRGPFAFDLNDILAECQGYADRVWVAWNIEWIGGDSCSDEDMEYFIDTCRGVLENTPDGQTALTFQDLERCARCAVQTENGVFMALQKGVDSVPLLHSLEDSTLHADVIIHAFAFSIWEVTTSDVGLLERLMSRFKFTELHARMME